MSKNVLVNINMNGNEVQNVVMQNLATAPLSPKLGQFYYNTGDKKAYQWNGTAWKPFASEIVIDSALSGTSTNPVQNKVINTALGNKVDKVSGKGLSTNDYTTAEKTKLSGIAEGANKTVVDTELDYGSTNPVQNGAVADALSFKVDKEIVTAEISSANGTKIPQVSAVMSYVGSTVSNAIAASDAMIFKGTLGTGGTVTSLPTTYKTGWTYRVITAGTYAGNVCEVGDLIIALVDRSGSSNANSDWTVAQTNINGAITNISGTSPVSVSGSGSSRSISHANSGVTAKTYGEIVPQTPEFGQTADVPYVTTNATGHVTGAGTATVKIPNSTATPRAAGLMSSEDKLRLDNILNFIAIPGTLIAGETSVDIAESESDFVTVLYSYIARNSMTGEDVILDVSSTNKVATFSIATAVDYDIEIKCIFL